MTHGARLDTCPWRSFTNPVVRDVIDLHRAAVTDREGGVHLASVRALNPANHIWEGVQLYAHLLTKNIEEIRALEAQRK